MVKKRNYQKELEEKLSEISGGQTGRDRPPSLLLHSCCAPCSSYVLEYLSPYFSITVFYYNPNISSSEEYERRKAEQKRLIREMPAGYPVSILEGDYEPDRFYEMAKGLEHIPEGGERCFLCYGLRLGESARKAKEGGYDYFTTTLSVSPLKNADKLNEIGERLAAVHGVVWLHSDFKKKDGCKRSIELSREYHLYRQDFCGCIYSKESRRRMSIMNEVQDTMSESEKNTIVYSAGGECQS